MSVNTRVSDTFSKFGKSVLNLAEVIKKTPGILTYLVNGEKEDLKNVPKLNSNNFKFYVGETKKQIKDQFYSEEFYIGAIANVVELLEKGGILDFEVGADVSKIMNEKGDNNGDMTTEEQIEFIRGIVRKKFKKFDKRINIIDTSKSHIELFQELEEKGLDSLGGSIVDLELGEDFNSQDIAKLLYGACKEDEKFFNKIKGTRPEYIKENGGKKSKYYSLVEIAFRLTDYINGINIHGGERRQERYDIIIRGIINGDYNHILPIKKIHDFLQKKQNLGTFNSLHFSEKAFEKEQERKEKVKKIRNLVGAVSLSVSMILGGITAGINIEKNKQEDEFNNRKRILMSKVLENVSMTEYYGSLGYSMYETDEKKYERINYLGEKLAKLFIIKYGEGNINGEELQLFFISKMVELNSYNFGELNYGDKLYLRLIDEILENPVNKTLLLSYGFEVDNYYGKYVDYKDIFLNTYKSDLDIEVKESDVEKIGEYIDKEGNSHEIALYEYEGKKYIVARYYETYNYTFENAREVSLDFLGTPFNYFILGLREIGDLIGNNFLNSQELISRLLVDKVVD